MMQWFGGSVFGKMGFCLKKCQTQMRRFGFIFAWGAIFTSGGCGLKGASNGELRFHDDGRAKPVVAFIPVSDQSGSEIGWSLSEELTDLLKNRLFKRRCFYISVPSSFDATSLGGAFSSEAKWIQEAFESYEYVIFVELVEHDIHPKEIKGSLLEKLTPSYELSMTARVRVFDLRGQEPEVILQEFIHKNYSMPKPSCLEVSDPKRWEKWTHHVSPLGLSHAQFCKEIISRIEEYIALSKSQ